MSGNQGLTNYEEEVAVEITVSKHDKQEPETYILRRRRGHRDRLENVTSRNQRLTSYEEEAIETTISKYDKQEPETYILRRGRGR